MESQLVQIEIVFTGKITAFAPADIVPGFFNLGETMGHFVVFVQHFSQFSCFITKFLGLIIDHFWGAVEGAFCAAGVFEHEFIHPSHFKIIAGEDTGVNGCAGTENEAESLLVFCGFLEDLNKFACTNNFGFRKRHTTTVLYLIIVGNSTKVNRICKAPAGASARRGCCIIRRNRPARRCSLHPGGS